MNTTAPTKETNQAITPEYIESVKKAASNLDNWKIVDDSPPPADTWQSESEHASQKIDTEIMRLLEMTPEYLTWEMARLCELIIQPYTETAEHMRSVAKIVSMVPQMLYIEALETVYQIMTAAKREIHSWGPPASAETNLALHHGFVLV